MTFPTHHLQAIFVVGRSIIGLCMSGWVTFSNYRLSSTAAGNTRSSKPIQLNIFATRKKFTDDRPSILNSSKHSNLSLTCHLIIFVVSICTSSKSLKAMELVAFPLEAGIVKELWTSPRRFPRAFKDANRAFTYTWNETALSKFHGNNPEV